MDYPASKNIPFMLVQLSLGAMLGGIVGYAIALTTGLNLIITTAAAAGLGIIITFCAQHRLYRKRTPLQSQLDKKNREAQAAETNNDSELLSISKAAEPPEETKQLTASKLQPLSSRSLGAAALTAEKPDRTKENLILTPIDSNQKQKQSLNTLPIATAQKDRSNSKLASPDRTPQKEERPTINDDKLAPKTGANQSLTASSSSSSPSSSEHEYSTPAQASPESSQSNSPTNSQRPVFRMSLNGQPITFGNGSNSIKRNSSYGETRPKF